MYVTNRPCHSHENDNLGCTFIQNHLNNVTPVQTNTELGLFVSSMILTLIPEGLRENTFQMYWMTGMSSCCIKS